MSYPEQTCVVLGCKRAVMRTAHGQFVYNRCPAHVAAVVTGAFGPELEARVEVPRLRFQPGVEQRPDAVPAA